MKLKVLKKRLSQSPGTLGTQNELAKSASLKKQTSFSNSTVEMGVTQMSCEHKDVSDTFEMEVQELCISNVQFDMESQDSNLKNGLEYMLDQERIEQDLENYHANRLDHKLKEIGQRSGCISLKKSLSSVTATREEMKEYKKQLR